MLPLAGVTFGSLAALVVIVMLLRPRTGIETLIARSAGSEGITLYASRRGEKTLLVTIIILFVTSGAGAVFAAGGWRIVLIVLAALLALALGSAVSALRRPRWLQLRPDGIESASLRSHSESTWRGLASSRMTVVSGRGGQMLARLWLIEGTPGYRELWHSRWELKRTAVDIEYMMTGVDGEALIRLIFNAITRPEVRPLFTSDKERVLRSLHDPSGPWSTSESTLGTL
jgi:hypothetical protein